MTSAASLALRARTLGAPLALSLEQVALLQAVLNEASLPANARLAVPAVLACLPMGSVESSIASAVVGALAQTAQHAPVQVAVAAMDGLVDLFSEDASDAAWARLECSALFKQLHGHLKAKVKAGKRAMDTEERLHASEVLVNVQGLMQHKAARLR